MEFKTQRELLEDAVASGNPDALVRLGDYYADESAISNPAGADFAEALRCYEAARERGSVKAIFRIGECFESGDGVPEDEKKAQELFRESADAGDGRGLFHMAQTLRDAGNRAKAEEYYEKACAADPDCFWDFASEYLDTSEDALFPFSPDKAEEILSRWLRCGNGKWIADAFGDIARKFEEGDGVPADLARAARLYRAVAETDASGRAAFRLGLMFEKGLGVAKDCREAERLYRLAISLGESFDAKQQLGLLLFDGADGVPANRVEAGELLWSACRYGIDAHIAPRLKAYFLPLAETGDVLAQFRLSEVLYSEERRSWTDLPRRRTEPVRREMARRYAADEAAKWAQAAAESGLAEAQFALWQNLNESFPEEAFAWLKRAADSDHAEALEKLAWMFEFGDTSSSVRKNLREAIRLYEKADAAGAEFSNDCRIGWCFMKLREWENAAAAWTRAFEREYAEDRRGEQLSAFVLATEFYAKGRGVSKDLRMAARLLELAAESHMWVARIALGEALWRGRGVPANPTRAVALFLREAEIEPFPQWRLAQAYALGRGVPARNFREAFRWFRRCVRTCARRARDRFMAHAQLCLHFFSK